MRSFDPSNPFRNLYNFMGKRDVLRDVVIGECRVLNVPHVEIPIPTPDGEKIVRDILVNIKLSEIYGHMKLSNIRCIDYNEFQV